MTRVSQQGFTLIEIIIVLALISFIASLGLMVGTDFYKRSGFRAERDLLVSELTRARNRSMANINQAPHGVHIQADNYILFEGAIYNPVDPNNEPVPANTAVSHTDARDIVFSQLDGGITAPWPPFALSSGSQSAPIDINSEGMIQW